MPGCDWIPGISQLKSAVQAVTGDLEGAARTQENFLKECPVVSQGTSLVQAIRGDKEGARDTQKRFLGTMNNVANGVPVVGHVKGVIHHAFGDSKGGNQAFNAATRTTVVLGAGAAAAVATGGLAAIPAGIAAGSTYDIADSIISEKPKGIVAVVDNAKKNPNGGNIFDATVAFVGDGMTGYAGGNIGTKIANNVKVGQLEAAQAGKVEQLTNGLGEMSSGDALKLGNEIKSLGNEIGAIKNQGVPQYYYDAKTNQMVVECSKGPVNVPAVPGPEVPQPQQQKPKQKVNVPAVPGPEVPQPQQQKPKQKVQAVEDGFDCDLYADEPLTCKLSPNEKDEILCNYKEQKPQKNRVTAQHKNSKIPTQEQLNRIKQDEQPPRNNTNERIVELTLRGWLHLQMPQQFPYTSAGLLNDVHQGFLHTFARHWNQWREFIPDIRAIMNGDLATLQPILEKIRSAADPEEARLVSEKLSEYRDEIVLAALRRIQILIYNFMQKQLTSANYLGEGLNKDGKVQVYFKVGNKIMVVCVSQQMYPAQPEFGDDRRVRTITTVFFIDSNKRNEVLIRKVFD